MRASVLCPLQFSTADNYDQDGQARSREDRKWRKEFEKNRQLLSDQIIATANNILICM